MRKISLALVLVAISIIGNAQTFKPFKVNVSTGYAIPGGKGAKGGVLFAIEPKYAVTDNISIGLRFETAIMARGTGDSSMAIAEVKASASYLLTGDYYFNTKDFRPFVGVGLGLFQTASAGGTYTVDGDGNAVYSGGTGSKFGFAPRAGFEYQHFRFGLEYNMAGTVGGISNNYMGIKLGFNIGGGRLK